MSTCAIERDTEEELRMADILKDIVEKLDRALDVETLDNHEIVGWYRDAVFVAIVNVDWQHRATRESIQGMEEDMEHLSAYLDDKFDVLALLEELIEDWPTADINVHALKHGDEAEYRDALISLADKVRRL